MTTRPDTPYNLPEKQAELIRDYLSKRTPEPPRRKLTGAKQWVVLFLMLIGLGVLYVVLFPWGFFLGGSFHPFPHWTGWGKMHSSTAGDYFLYVEVWPSTRRLETVIPHTFVQGKAYLCTPKGEHFYLKLSGSMRPHIYLNTLGEPIGLSMYNWRAAMPIGQQERPDLSIQGRWGPGQIVGDDKTTLSQSFLPNGTLRPQNTYAPLSQKEDVQLTLHEGTYSEWEAACSAARH
jgi:hypothetical protein